VRKDWAAGTCRSRWSRCSARRDRSPRRRGCSSRRNPPAGPPPRTRRRRALDPTLPGGRARSRSGKGSRRRLRPLPRPLLRLRWHRRSTPGRGPRDSRARSRAPGHTPCAAVPAAPGHPGSRRAWPRFVRVREGELLGLAAGEAS
jgi:hypothetical protein